MTERLFQPAPGHLPGIGNPERAALGLRNWLERSANLADSEAAEKAKSLAEDRPGKRLLEAIFGNSPFLGRCALADPGFCVSLLTEGPDVVVGQVEERLKADFWKTGDRPAVMRDLRRARRELALAVAVADITDLWPLGRVTETLSRFAERALSAALSHLLHQGAAQGNFAPADPDHPDRQSGYVVLAMGKLGALELNYSSDIDLIVIYDPERCTYRGKRSRQEAYARLTHDLVSMIEERTADGYVFRTDLRLRPDPGAMPVAISFNAAMAYYESMGQNWERAAMIKARPVAGDLVLGEALRSELRPFVWRRHLDFWAIQDIHSIKRQINAHRGTRSGVLAGQDIKLGRGGIREIEFFAQTQQLIYGGRDPKLRDAQTLKALQALKEADHIGINTVTELAEAYSFLRRLEHRLQMIEDQQTQILPKDEAALAELAAFMGYDGLESFEKAVRHHMSRVEKRYARLFEEAPGLGGPGTLVFTGGEAHPGTLETLDELGFQDGERVFNLVRSWHHGRLRATRSTRSRELLTELMPAILRALANTPEPDAAMARFDTFLSGLPAGVQLFSMLAANPALLELLAEIMGSAPALAEHLGRKPDQLEAVLTPGFFDPVPDPEALARELSQAFRQAKDFQDILDFSRRWANDRRFQVGLGLIRHCVETEEAGTALSDIADSVLRGLIPPVAADLARRHGRVDGAGMAIVALGKLGAREMTATSDLDLIFLYEAPDETSLSDGEKPLAPSQYYARLAQRYINAVTALTPEGRLYDIDMRLRPSGTSGPIAATLAGFQRYHEQDSWTWEAMALTRARVVCGDKDFAGRIAGTVRDLLIRRRDPDTLLVDVASMRARIGREMPAKSLWNLKQVRGGLTDIDFIAQYLMLRHAAAHPRTLDPSTQCALAKLAEAGVIGSSLASRLIDTVGLLRALQGHLRLTVGEDLDEDSAPAGLKTALAKAGGAESFGALKDKLIAGLQMAHEAFAEIVEEPAKLAVERLAEEN